MGERDRKIDKDVTDAVVDNTETNNKDDPNIRRENDETSNDNVEENKEDTQRENIETVGENKEDIEQENIETLNKKDMQKNNETSYGIVEENKQNIQRENKETSKGKKLKKIKLKKEMQKAKKPKDIRINFSVMGYCQRLKNAKQVKFDIDVEGTTIITESNPSIIHRVKSGFSRIHYLTETRVEATISPFWRQSLAALASVLLNFTEGLSLGYSAVLLPQLHQSGNRTIHHTSNSTDESSWIASMAALPLAPGCLISGWIMEKFGRKVSHYIVAFIFRVGWFFIAFANRLFLLLLGRFCCGLSAGLMVPLVPVFIGEISDPKYRAFFISAVSLASALGILVSHLVGTFVPWHFLATLSSIIPFISVILFLLLVPESPAWLIAKGNTESGVKAFFYLRGYDEEAKAELKELLEKRTDRKEKQTFKECKKTLTSRALLMPLSVMIIFFITCQFSGMNAVVYYSVFIVGKAVGHGINVTVAVFIIDIVRVFTSVVACIICRMCGRRPLCFISGIFTGLSMLVLSLFLCYADPQDSMSWFPLICLTVYVIAISIGFVPLPWIMLGEIFPADLRGLGSGLSSATTFMVYFFVIKSEPWLSEQSRGLEFLVYGVSALVGTTILYFILPETNGKRLQAIEDTWIKRVRSRSRALRPRQSRNDKRVSVTGGRRDGRPRRPTVPSTRLPVRRPSVTPSPVRRLL